jgi:molybdopterin-binding protein
VWLVNHDYCVDLERRIGGGNTITSSITMASLKDLGLKKGSPVVAIIKANEVILGVDD